MSKISGHLLIIDDDEHILLTARVLLRRFFESVSTLSGAEEIESVLAGKSFDVVLLDMNLRPGNTSGAEGLSLLKKIRALQPAARVVLMTAYGDIGLAVKAMKEGAVDFVVKPWNNDELSAAVKSALLMQPFGAAGPPEAGVYDGSPDRTGSQAMEEVWKMVDKVAPTDANVLIQGENGTGKEVVARRVHRQSGRSGAPFVHVDLGAVAPSLFESELFGHEKGAFTDARALRRGPFELAEGGTLFLDEIGNLPLPLQSKLLTVLQTRKVTRVGANRPLDVDFRLICATNANLASAVAGKQFRDDLYFRINTVEINMPPLRERGSDIVSLAQTFMAEYAARYGKPGLKTGSEVIRSLMAYEWPGNIRELQHVIERGVIMSDGNILTPADLRLPSQSQVSGTDPLNLESLEKDAIRRALLRHGGNLTQAARELGLGRTTLYRKMEKYGL